MLDFILAKKQSWFARKQKKLTLLFFFSWFLFSLLSSACSDSSSSSAKPSNSTNFAIDAKFERIDQEGLDPFNVIISVSNENKTTNETLSANVDDFAITLSRGTHSIIQEQKTNSNVTYQFTVQPEQTGEHKVSITYKNTNLSKTALVIENTHPDWGQAMSVSGLVNTEGYEDGITITPDGEYLFVQYGPVYFSGLITFNTPRANGGCGGKRLSPSRCNKQWIDDTIGPITAPERPDFFNGRILNGKWLHNANSWRVGVEQSPIFAPSTMFYGFKRQADGSFAEPFFVAFNDENDGIANPAGLSFLLNGDGTATILFFHNDVDPQGSVDHDENLATANIDSGFDIYTATILLGKNNSLGNYEFSGTIGTPPLRSLEFNSSLINFGKTGIKGIAGTQGNPHLHSKNGNIQSIWTDDEFDETNDLDNDYGKLSLYILSSGGLSDGSWQKVILPEPVNLTNLNSKEIQPFFKNKTLYFTRSDDTSFPEIFKAEYSGEHLAADYTASENWQTPERILGVDSPNTVGQITAIGEPTVAEFENEEYLYFVYGVIRDTTDISGFPDINMQAGYIKKR